MKVTISEDPADFDAVVQSVKALGRKQVKVGLPPKAGGQLRFILAVQTHGSPVMRIPARPVVEPALASSQVREEMASAMVSAVEAAWNGDEGGAQAGLEAAGKAGADGIRAYIDSGSLAPNAPVTVSGGWIWNRKAQKGVHVPGKGFDKPLYDTGELYHAFTFEIED